MKGEEKNVKISLFPFLGVFLEEEIIHGEGNNKRKVFGLT